ncbi:MAG: 4Fe-4S binding protein [Desulfobacteraceae bacterium]|nr:4Fe-4S binding protein [Desulfobacteraceae bacterium]
MKPYPIEARPWVQILFLLVVVFIGARFYLFVSCIEKGVTPHFERPAGVEAFLPIGALVSLKHLLYTGTINRIHPSGLVLFLMSSFTAVLVKKGFCSWVCPVGTLSEYVYRGRRPLFQKHFQMPAVADILLRALKYVIAGFFMYQIFYKMPMDGIEQFIQSPYNRFADIHMLKFFTRMSATAFTVLMSLVALSILFRHFWCRYLCPYGALLGIIGLASLGKIRRDPSHCTGCGRCEKNCPGMIPIQQKTVVHSLECSACLTCIESCPEKKALKFTGCAGRSSLPAAVMALGWIIFFSGGITLAIVTGKWQNEIPAQAYVNYAVSMNREVSPIGRMDGMDPEKMQRMALMMKRLQEARKNDPQQGKGD